MIVFDIVSNAAMALIGLYFIIILFEKIKPGMNYTQSLFVVWFYATVGLFCFIAYRVGTTGMI